MSSPATALTEFQIEVARLFFSLPAGGGFLLTGGAALVAQHLTSRPTALAQHYGRELLLERAAAVDLGFDHGQLAYMMSFLDRYTDADLPMPAAEAGELRRYFREWRDALTAR